MSSENIKTEVFNEALPKSSSRGTAPQITAPSQVAKQHSLANDAGLNAMPVAPARDPSARTRKHMNYNETEMAATWDSTPSTETSIASGHDNDHPDLPQTPAALAQHLAKLKHSGKSQQSAPSSSSAGETEGGLFDRPSPLVVWKPRSKAVLPQHALYQQRKKRGRFYTKDTSLGQARASFFQNISNMCQVILMMETTLGMEHHGDDSCQACIERDIPCVRYIEGADLQIRRCGSSCAWCRFHIASGGCSKTKAGRKRKRDSSGDEEDEEDESDQPALEVVEVPAPSTENGTANAITTAVNDDDRARVRHGTQQVASKTISQPNSSASEDLHDHPVTRRSSSHHSILCLEALVDELGEDDADEARALFSLIKRNLEKGRETKSLINTLTRLFVPLQQHITKEYDRLSNEFAQVSQQKQIFDRFDVAADGMDVYGKMTAVRGEELGNI